MKKKPNKGEKICYHRHVKRDCSTYPWHCVDCGKTITQEEKLKAWKEDDREQEFYNVAMRKQKLECDVQLKTGNFCTNEGKYKYSGWNFCAKHILKAYGVKANDCEKVIKLLKLERGK
jgi:hypothetical protein